VQKTSKTVQYAIFCKENATKNKNFRKKTKLIELFIEKAVKRQSFKITAGIFEPF